MISSHEVMGPLSESMKQRMAEQFHIHAHETDGKFTDYPLYIKDKRIGTLLNAIPETGAKGERGHI